MRKLSLGEWNSINYVGLGVNIFFLKYGYKSDDIFSLKEMLSRGKKTLIITE